MTTIYPSKEMAINMGIYYATGQFERSKTDLKKIEGEIEQFGTPIKSSEMYELTNSRGQKATFAVSPCRDGYDLWFVLPNGMTMRT